jgi:hypothetical protein
MKKPLTRKFYTDDDVLRWEQRASETIPFQVEALRKPGIDSNIRWQRFGHLSGAYDTLAMIAIAKKRFDEARDNLRKSIEFDFEQYEICRAKGEATSAGHFQEILLAYVTKDQPLISKMLNYYTWVDGIPESVYLGKVIKSLGVGDLSIAQLTLDQKRPRMEKMFDAYPDCLQAMVHKDAGALQTAISVGSKNWARRAARFEKGLPYAVCFIQGAGLVRLAEHVMGAKLSITDENIPAELLA